MNNKILKITGFLFMFFLHSLVSKGQSDDFEHDKSEINKVLAEQVIFWNKGDLKEYMSGYWNGDSLRFIGKSGLKYGWQATLDNYRKSYPDKSAMGILKFDILSVEIICVDYGFVVGKWALKREKDNLNGSFTLLFKKINGKWQIICDHSS